MGGCFSAENGRRPSRGYFGNEMEEKEWCEEDELEDDMRYGDSEARIRLRGSSEYTSMFTKQGRKGINQDAMTIWENFSGEKDMLLCGVFDGHGPYGHKVARHVRDTLPSKLSKAVELSKLNSRKFGDVNVLAGRGLAPTDELGEDDEDDGDENSEDGNSSSSIVLPLFSWEACFIKSFKEMDEELGAQCAVDDTFCSGSTAVIVVKQGDNLMVANLGDSRAILCTRGDKNQLTPIQLTVDLKPDIPSECERIRRCRGRVLAADEEPDVYRVWMPDDDCPGLAMARAFGDFCLKDYGLISIPDVSYRRLTDNDEFVVLATDGVWDALTNTEVVTIVASARKRSMAARMVVNRAIQSWRVKYPGCKVDDCAAVCLFFKPQPSPATLRSTSLCGSDFSAASFKSLRSESTVERRSFDDWNALQGVNRANSLVKLPRFLSFRRSSSGFHEVEAH